VLWLVLRQAVFLVIAGVIIGTIIGGLLREDWCTVFFMEWRSTTF